VKTVYFIIAELRAFCKQPAVAWGAGITG